jgi:hypothetical protein
MRPSRPVVLLGVLVGILVVGSALLVRNETPAIPLSSQSSHSNGARALLLWLESLGYRVEQLDAEPYAVPEGLAALLVLLPTESFDREAVEQVAEWVEAGGRLVVVASPETRRLLERFDLVVRFAGSRSDEATAVQPVLLHPTVGRVRVEAWDRLEGREGLAPWLAAGDRVVAGSRTYGQGQVVVLTAPYPLSNEGLASAESAALALNLVAGLAPGARIAFDEYHHGVVRASATRSLWRLLLTHYWGWAILYAVAVGYLYLWLRGRRFGPPLTPVAAPRRSVSEYVASLASLYRRAGQRAYVADRLADQLKRELATALGVSARLPDAEFARVVAERRATSPGPLAAVLGRLRGRRLSEADLLATTREADALKAGLLGRPARGA